MKAMQLPHQTTLTKQEQVIVRSMPFMITLYTSSQIMFSSPLPCLSRLDYLLCPSRFPLHTALCAGRLTYVTHINRLPCPLSQWEAPMDQWRGEEWSKYLLSLSAGHHTWLPQFSSITFM